MHFTSCSTLFAVLCASVGMFDVSAARELTADMTTSEPVMTPVTTSHSLRIGRERVRYTATFSELLLTADGTPHATISATSYLRAAPEAERRPVIFAFNGGPGASSSPLHFGALGPKRWAQKRSEGLIENPYSLLDVADLVFVDPVGTGFSRGRPNGNPSLYWSIAGDAQAMLTFVREWLKQHARTQSPIFITGESYGGFRLATMAADLHDLPIAGLILVSPMLDASGSSGAPGNDMPFVFELPSLATTAWFHERIDRRGRSVEQFFDEATRFAQTDYLTALQQGASLPAAQRTAIAARMASFIGLSPQSIEADHLRIDSQKFLETLLADRQLLVGRVDTRVTAPKPTAPPADPKRAPAADDPALGLKGSNVIKSDTIKSYLERELNVRTSRDYLSLTLDVNFRWNWRGDGQSPEFYINPTPNFAPLMAKQPRARILLLGGFFDLATPLLAPRYALTHAGVPLERVDMHAFAGGHSPFEGEAQLAAMSQVVHAFILR